MYPEGASVAPPLPLDGGGRRGTIFDLLENRSPRRVGGIERHDVKDLTPTKNVIVLLVGPSVALLGRGRPTQNP